MGVLPLPTPLPRSASYLAGFPTGPVCAGEWGHPSMSQTTSSKTQSQERPKRCPSLTPQNTRTSLKVNIPLTCFTLLRDVCPEGTKLVQRGALCERLLQVTSFLSKVFHTSLSVSFLPVPGLPQLRSQVPGFRMGGLLRVTSYSNISSSQAPLPVLSDGICASSPGFPAPGVLSPRASLTQIQNNSLCLQRNVCA